MMYGLKEIIETLQIKDFDQKNEALEIFNPNSYIRTMGLLKACQMTDDELIEAIQEPFDRASFLTLQQYEIDMIDRDVFSILEKIAPTSIRKIECYREKTDPIEIITIRYVNIKEGRYVPFTDAENALLRINNALYVMKEQYYFNVMQSIRHVEKLKGEDITFLLKDIRNYYAIKRNAFEDKSEAILFCRSESLIENHFFEIQKTYGVQMDRFIALDPSDEQIMNKYLEEYRMKHIDSAFQEAPLPKEHHTNPLNKIFFENKRRQTKHLQYT